MLEVFHLLSQRKNAFADSSSRKFIYLLGSGGLYKQNCTVVLASFLF